MNASFCYICPLNSFIISGLLIHALGYALEHKDKHFILLLL